MKIKKGIRTPILIFSLIGIIISMYSLQQRIDRIKLETRKIEDLKYLPSGKFIKPAALGFDELLADLLWIKAVTYFGGHYLTDRQYNWLYHILDITTTLDPRSEYAYEFGGIILSIEANQIKESVALLKKGIENHPGEWKLPFLLGFIHFYYLNDYKLAAHYIEKASLLPNRPSFLPGLAATLYTKAHTPELGIEFLTMVYNSTNDERVRKNIEKKIKEITAGSK
jgi:tetratricopeptide (TPR) repeat protein